MVTDKTRREAFITQNLGLVHACAGRFRGRGMEYDDLYSAGCVGLIKAYDNFDESRGVCFSTYAVPVILGEIKKLFRDGGTVKVSRSLKELGMRVQAAREHTMKLCGSEPTLQQLAEQLDEPIENVALAIQAAQPAMSLTPEGGEDGDRQLDIPVESPEEELADRIETLGIQGKSHLVFVIGGSIGLGREVLRRSDYALSFSKMTFPHQLMRVILLEQIYRSYRIINGEPYHK